MVSLHLFTNNLMPQFVILLGIISLTYRVHQQYPLYMLSAWQNRCALQRCIIAWQVMPSQQQEAIAVSHHVLSHVQDPFTSVFGTRIFHGFGKVLHFSLQMDR